MVEPWGEENCSDIVCENSSSWNLVDDGDPVITAATAAERHKNDLVQRQGNLVGCHVVLDVVCDALAESLEGEAE